MICLEYLLHKKYIKVSGHKDIYRSDALFLDLEKAYSDLEKSSIILDATDLDRASRISPIYQLLRRYFVSSTKQEFDRKQELFRKYASQNRGKTRIEERKKVIVPLEESVDRFVAENYEASSLDTPLDRIYDSLSKESLEKIFSKVFERSTNKKDGREDEEKKNGLFSKGLIKKALSKVTKKDVDMSRNEEKKSLSRQEKKQEIDL